MHCSVPDTPHWYLGVLATHPSHAGQRLGRLAMQAGLTRAERDGLPAYLETTNPGHELAELAAGQWQPAEAPQALMWSSTAARGGR